MYIDPFNTWLWRCLAIFLLLAACCGTLLAVLLIFRPQLLEPLNRIANRWISTRHLSQILDRSFSIEYWFYRHHGSLGIAVMLGAVYILCYFGLWFDRYNALRQSSHFVPGGMLEGLLDALVLSALTGATLALAVGLFLWLRPSMLRDMEIEANRWVSSRRATKVLEIPRDRVDRFVAYHARRVGWLLLLASIYLFFIMLRLFL